MDIGVWLLVGLILAAVALRELRAGQQREAALRAHFAKQLAELAALDDEADNIEDDPPVPVGVRLGRDAARRLRVTGWWGW